MICYIYKASEQDAQVKLTNMNRTEFTLNVDANDVKPDTGKYSNMVVFAGLKKDGKWTFSDNYIMYIDGTAYSHSISNE